MNSKRKDRPSISDILFCFSILIGICTIPWGFLQFVAGRGYDWLVLSASGLYAFTRLLCEVSQ